MPDKLGKFQLYSDTSKYATGGALYQIQNGKPKLIAYSSKRLPEAACNYSIRVGDVWISDKYCKLCTFIEKSRF